MSLEPFDWNDDSELRLKKLVFEWSHGLCLSRLRLYPDAMKSSKLCRCHCLRAVNQNPSLSTRTARVKRANGKVQSVWTHGGERAACDDDECRRYRCELEVEDKEDESVSRWRIARMMKLRRHGGCGQAKKE